MQSFNEKLRKKIWYLENKDRLIKKQKLYNNEHKETIKEYKQSYREKHLNHLRKLNRENMRIKDKTEMMLIRHRNKCKKLGLGHNLTLKQWEYILQYFNNGCAFCNNTEVYVGYVVGHSREFSKGFVLGNIVPICKSCRSSKINRNLDEWTNFNIILKHNNEKASKVIEYMNMED